MLVTPEMYLNKQYSQPVSYGKKGFVRSDFGTNPVDEDWQDHLQHVARHLSELAILLVMNCDVYMEFDSYKVLKEVDVLMKYTSHLLRNN